MLYKSILLSTLLACRLFAQQPSAERPCCESPRPMRITARHIEANGIGYNQGYTTLEGFFSWNNDWSRNWMPFLDLRGHAFNNGRLAANAGLGVRYLSSSRVWGLNGYYDYRDTHRMHYNQVSLGLESLGAVWDFRINGYLPVGAKSSRFYDKKFWRFQGHHLIIARKFEYAFKGANAEVGAHIDMVKNVPFYFAAGPYYLNGRGQSGWGGSARLTVDFFDCLKLEGSTSYDHIFKWVGQGQVGLSISFGGKKAVKPREGHAYPDEVIVRQRAVQRVDRFEIVPVDHSRKEFAAINPATGLPYEFIFVDNTSSSNGTFESPFPTLLQAQLASKPYDIIYVFQGDGTSKGMDAGITLQDFQQMFGSGNTHPLATTLGLITIPIFTPQKPIVTNLTGNAVTLANQNTISGFQIPNGGEGGLYGSSIAGVTVEENLFTAGLEFESVALFEARGAIVLHNNSFISNAPTGSMLPNSSAILVENSTVALSVANNAFHNIGSVGTQFVDVFDTGGELLFDRNTFVTDGPPNPSLQNDIGIRIDNLNVTAAVAITNNSFQNQGGFGALIIPQGSASHNIAVINNTFVAPVGFFFDGSSMMFPFPPGSVMPMGLQIGSSDTSTANVAISGNRFFEYEVTGISVQTMGNAETTSAIISNYVQPGLLAPHIMDSIARTGIEVLALENSTQTSAINHNTITACKSAGIAFANLSTGNSDVVCMYNIVSNGGQDPGGTIIGGGIGVALENAGNLTARVINNTFSQNLGQGGCVALNLPVFGPTGTLCLELLNNVSDTGYTLYNPAIPPHGGPYPLLLEEGYQTNVGLINGVPPTSTMFPPASPPAMGLPVGGPITIVPTNTCP